MTVHPMYLGDSYWLVAARAYLGTPSVAQLIDEEGMVLAQTRNESPRHMDVELKAIVRCALMPHIKLRTYAVT
jgi:hypothetical protein